MVFLGFNISSTQLNNMKPLILLHGALGSQAQLQALAYKLSSTRTVYTLNFLGHGGRPFPKSGFDMSLFVQDIEQFMAEKKIALSDFFGYSMGGYAALCLALQAPQKVGKIFTLGTKFDWTAESAAKETKMLDPDIILAKVPKFAQMLELRHQPQDWRKLLELTAKMMWNLSEGAALQAEQCSKISQKVRINVGEADNMVSIEESKSMSEAIPNASFKILPAVPHPIEKVDIELLQQELELFLAD